MVVGLNVFSMRMEHEIGCEECSTEVVTPQCRRKRKSKMKFLEEKLKPENFSDSDSQSFVLRFCTGSRDSVLFLCTPRNEIAIKI
jgi:hypothetical protein